MAGLDPAIARRVENGGNDALSVTRHLIAGSSPAMTMSEVLGRLV